LPGSLLCQRQYPPRVLTCYASIQRRKAQRRFPPLFTYKGEVLLPSLYGPKSSVAAILCLLGLCWITFCPANAADRTRSLPPHYRHWLNEEVNYIISTDEKK